MEQYLLDQYDVIEDKRWLKDESDIEDYFKDIARDYMECGQGFYTDEADFICKIGDKFYEVHVTAVIGGAKQDRGDRLYWIENIEEVTYEEIDKPEPKSINKIIYALEVTDIQKRMIDEFLESNNIKKETII